MRFCRDPEYYPNPEIFDPERFTEAQRKLRHKALHLPFGFGPKSCMGQNFGYLQVKAGAMALVRDFKITLASHQKPLEQSTISFVALPKERIHLRFEPR